MFFRPKGSLPYFMTSLLVSIFTFLIPELHCKVEFFPDEDGSIELAKPHVVDWLFMSSNSGSDLATIAVNGMVTEEASPRWRSTVRRSWNFVVDGDVEEHYITLKEGANKEKDEGFYICRVRRLNRTIVSFQDPFRL